MVQVVDYSKILARLQPQQLAPGTPTHSQDSPHQPDASAEVTSPATATAAAQPPQAQSSCRADLSGAALLLCQHLNASADSVDVDIHARGTRPPGGSPARRREVFANGNYNRYYGYRLAAGETEDPRLQVRHLLWQRRVTFEMSSFATERLLTCSTRQE